MNLDDRVTAIANDLANVLTDTPQGVPPELAEAETITLDLLIDVTDRAVEANAWMMEPLAAARVNRRLNDIIEPAYDLHPDYPTRPY